MTIKLKRAYDPAAVGDGYRVYVDRLWPRGLSHETFHYDLWEKDIAPDDDLRKWFHENPDVNWDGFKSRYKEALNNNPNFAKFCAVVSAHPVVTLLYSSHDKDHNNAVVVEELLEEKSKTT